MAYRAGFKPTTLWSKGLDSIVTLPMRPPPTMRHHVRIHVIFSSNIHLINRSYFHSSHFEHEYLYINSFIAFNCPAWNPSTVIMSVKSITRLKQLNTCYAAFSSNSIPLLFLRSCNENLLQPINRVHKHCSSGSNIRGWLRLVAPNGQDIIGEIKGNETERALRWNEWWEISKGFGWIDRMWL